MAGAQEKLAAFHEAIAEARGFVRFNFIAPLLHVNLLRLYGMTAFRGGWRIVADTKVPV